MSVHHARPRTNNTPGIPGDSSGFARLSLQARRMLGLVRDRADLAGLIAAIAFAVVFTFVLAVVLP